MYTTFLILSSLSVFPLLAMLQRETDVSIPPKVMQFVLIFNMLILSFVFFYIAHIIISYAYPGGFHATFK